MEPVGASGDSTVVDVLEFTDPFCSWAWSTEPKLRLLRAALGPGVRWRQVVGVLFDGERDDRALSVRVADQLERWDAVVAHTGAPLPAQLERPATTSRVAARAVKAAELQGLGLGGRTLRRLRESLFVFGRPADDEAGIAEALQGVPGLDVELLRADLDSAAVRDAAEADWQETRDPLPEVIGLEEPLPHPGGAAPDGDRLRYRFPTVVVRGPAGRVAVPGWRPLDTYLDAVAAVAPGRTLDPAPRFAADDALVRFETLTRTDLELLTGGLAPAGAVRLALRNGPVWVDPKRFARRAARPAFATAGESQRGKD